jgi:serine/threonine protein kinase
MALPRSITAPTTTSAAQVAQYQHHKSCLQGLASTCSSPIAAGHLHAFVIKLCDFGAALVNTEGPGGAAVGVTPRGTSRFCSPQVMSGLINRGVTAGLTTLWSPVAHPDLVRSCAASYDAFAADVWSFGATLYALAAGSEPFRAAGPQCAHFRAFVQATQPRSLHDEVMCPASHVWGGNGTSASAPSSWGWPECFSPALVHLLSGCLRVRENERFTKEAVKTHPWFKDPTWVPLPPVCRLGTLLDLEMEAGVRHASTTLQALVPPRYWGVPGESTASPTDRFLRPHAPTPLAWQGKGDTIVAPSCIAPVAHLHKQLKQLPRAAPAAGGSWLPSSAAGSAVGPEAGPQGLLSHSLWNSEGDPLGNMSTSEGGGCNLASMALYGSRNLSESHDAMLAN